MRIRLTASRPMHQLRPAPPARSRETRRPRSMLLRACFRSKVDRYCKLCTSVLARAFILCVGLSSILPHSSSWCRHRVHGPEIPQRHQVHDNYKTRTCLKLMALCQRKRLPTRPSDGTGIGTTAGSTDNHSMAQASTVPKRRRRARGGAGVEGVASRGHGREPLGAPTH